MGMLLLRSMLASIIAKVGETAVLQGPLTRLSVALAFTVPARAPFGMSAPGVISKSGGMKLRSWPKFALGDGMLRRRVMDEDAPGLLLASVADQEGSNVVAEAPDPRPITAARATKARMSSRKTIRR